MKIPSIFSWHIVLIKYPIKLHYSQTSNSEKTALQLRVFTGYRIYHLHFIIELLKFQLISHKSRSIITLLSDGSLEYSQLSINRI